SCGEVRTRPLAGGSVAEFYQWTLGTLGEFDIHPHLIARPFDPPRVGSDTPFTEDRKPAPYDPVYAQRFWRILLAVDDIFREFRGRFVGKCSPIHFFWHSFDLAVTRFSGRRTEVSP